MQRIQHVDVIELYSKCFLVQTTDYRLNGGSTTSFKFKLNPHSIQRCQERDIDTDEIASAMLFGYSREKNGVRYYALTNWMVPMCSGFVYRSHKGLVVIFDERYRVVKTCYRHWSPENHVRKLTSPRKPNSNMSFISHALPTRIGANDPRVISMSFPADIGRRSA
jgi:hypothetical protein